ncbi:hypothetical protein U3516DRAFT_757608 [Neocallimastix sp. 'constans']
MVLPTIVVFSILSIFWNIDIFEVAKFREPYFLAILKGDAPVVITQEKENLKIDRSDNKGSHYIHFVPYSRALFNPDGNAFCIYEFLISNEKINIDDKPKVRRHLLPIEEIGKIRLIGISDEIYGEGKVDTKNSKEAYIINCPKASLIESFIEVCVKDLYDVNFLATENEIEKQLEIRDSIHFDLPIPGSYLFKTFPCKSDHIIPATTNNLYQTNFIVGLCQDVHI